MSQNVYFVGTEVEIGHHATPMLDRLNIRIIDPEKVVDIAKPGDLAVFYTEHFNRFREACVALKSNRVATLYMIDGILEWRNAWENRPDEVACPWTMRPVLSHKVAAIGPSQARILRSWGNEDKVEIVGVPRFDHLGPNLKRKKQDHKFRILVATAKYPGFTDEQIDTTVHSLHDLKSWFNKNPSVEGRELEVHWRLTRDLDQRIGVNNNVSDLTGKELIAQLRMVDALITTPSTSILEGMLHGIPVASVDYHNCPTYVPTAWAIHSKQNISKIIHELRVPPPEKMLYQRHSLEDSLYLSTAATDRLASLICKMMEYHVIDRKIEEELRFPGNMLEPVDGASQQRLLHHASVFDAVDAFQNNDVITLQSQLGHINREHQALQKQLYEANELATDLQKKLSSGPVTRSVGVLKRLFHRFISSWTGSN